MKERFMVPGQFIKVRVDITWRPNCYGFEN
jgi:hypothetical protein